MTSSSRTTAHGKKKVTSRDLKVTKVHKVFKVNVVKTEHKVYQVAMDVMEHKDLQDVTAVMGKTS